MQNIAMQAGFVVAILGGGSAFIGLIYAMYKVAKRIEAAIGVDKDGRTLSERMEKVEYQLWENGGKSLKDKVNKNEITGQHTADEVSFIKEDVKFVKEVLLQLLALPEMHADPETAEALKANKKK